MNGARREHAAFQRLRDLGAGHAALTLRCLGAHALTEARDDEHPRGWVTASVKWLEHQTGRTQPTITNHVRLLIDAGEIIEWEPSHPRSGRPREYVVTWIAGVRGVKQVQMELYRKQQDPLRNKGQQPKDYPKPTMGAGPVFALAEIPAETDESSETLTPQGPAGKVDCGPLLVISRRSGKDNHTPENAEPASAVTVTRTQFQDSIGLDESCATDPILQSHTSGDLRGEHPEPGHTIGHAAIKHGSEEGADDAGSDTSTATDAICDEWPSINHHTQRQAGT